ncbi:MAG: FecR domain-containing protein [Anaerolineae bacterium]|nr:FecR domain-containing protein [Anaerolineae bacterium]
MINKGHAMDMSWDQSGIQPMRKYIPALRYVLVATCLLLGVPVAYAAPPANATEYVTQVLRNVEDLERASRWVSLMAEMESIDQSIQAGACKHSVDAISAARNPADKRIAFEGFERCFDAALQRKPASEALREMGATSYRGLDAAYRKVLKEEFNGKRIDFAAKGADLAREINHYLGHQGGYAAILVSVLKDVQVKKGGSGEWLRARQGDLLNATDLVRTGDSSRARIEFMDRFQSINSGPSVITVGPDATINLAEFKIDLRNQQRHKGLVDMLKGAIRVFSKGWGGRADFSVRTGTSLCGIRGTDIEIHYDPDEDRTYYKLYEGVVEISTPHESFTLRAGSSVSVTRGMRSEIMPIAPPT